jgi:hypothetical protein
MPANLELGDVPCRVLVCRPLDKAKLSFVRRVVAVDVQRDLNC